MNKIIFGLIIVSIIVAGCKRQDEEVAIEQWDVFEIVLNGPSSGNPFLDVELSAVFNHNTLYCIEILSGRNFIRGLKSF